MFHDYSNTLLLLQLQVATNIQFIIDWQFNQSKICLTCESKTAK